MRQVPDWLEDHHEREAAEFEAWNKEHDAKSALLIVSCSIDTLEKALAALPDTVETKLCLSLTERLRRTIIAMEQKSNV